MRVEKISVVVVVEGLGIENCIVPGIVAKQQSMQVTGKNCVLDKVLGTQYSSSIAAKIQTAFAIILEVSSVEGLVVCIKGAKSNVIVILKNTVIESCMLAIIAIKAHSSVIANGRVVYSQVVARLDAYPVRDGISNLKIELKYHQGNPVIKKIKRISKPGIRVYSKINELPKPYGGLGISIISTPKGVMSDQQARVNNVGGEILCEVF